jgi:hypothetical protein
MEEEEEEEEVFKYLAAALNCAFLFIRLVR